MKTQQLSRLMSLSWRIQKSRKSGRSKALVAAWAILLNEDITVYYLVQKHSHTGTGYRNKVQPETLTLFNS